MITILLKIIGTMWVVYGGTWLLFSGLLAAPFTLKNNYADEGPDLKETIGLILTVIICIVVTVCGVMIVWWL